MTAMHISINPLRLKQICNAPISAFHNLGEYIPCKLGGYTFIDNNAPILAVGHLDTVLPKARHFNLSKGIVYSPQLDDRLGVYTLLDILPKLGIACDVLLTEHEETVNSTAQYFIPPRSYNWIFELDRAGIDVVMYDYETRENRQRCTKAHWHTGIGSYSDICDLEHLGVSAFNFGIGYRRQHTVHCFVPLVDWYYDVKRFSKFYSLYKNTSIKHTPISYDDKWYWKSDNYYGSAATGDKDSYCPLCDTYYTDLDNLVSIGDSGFCDLCSRYLDSMGR